MNNPVTRFWHELQRRKVIRVAIAYGIIGWVIIEVSSVILPALLLPEWSHRLVVVLIALGFPAALILAWVFELSPEGLKRESHEAGAAGQGLVPAAASPATPPDALLTDARRSIVVLPFTNLSAENGSEFFSDGITEEILTLLARQPGLRVVSRTTSFSFKGSQAAVHEIANQLEVELVLEGSVRRADKQLRIKAQLIDPVTDTQIWSNQYDRELTDVFAVQGEIARCIVDALELDPETCQECKPPTLEIEAYDYYLRGRQYFHYLTRPSMGFARQMFRQAIAIDPGYGRAWAGLADTESITAQWFDHSAEHVEAADQASRKALELAPDLAEAHSSRGFALTLRSDFKGAAAEFQKALDIDPENYDALYLFGRSRYAEGKMQEAADLFRRAHEAQPDEFQAASLREGALRAVPGSPEYEEALLLALRATQRRLELNPDDQRAMHLGCSVLIASGQVEEGLRLARHLMEVAPDDPGSLYNALCAFALAGEHDEALELLERRIAMGGLYRNWVEQDPDFESLRNDPRFLALLATMEVWEA